MSLQRRLLVYLLICAPLVWGVALFVSIRQARHEVNELFDTELISLARQVQATLGFDGNITALATPAPARGTPEAGSADMRELAIAVWDSNGKLLLADREGVQLTRYLNGSGFRDEKLEGKSWRVYYLQSAAGEWLVASGQRTKERDDLVLTLITSQIAPWLLVLPALLAAMAWAVRRAISPVHQLAAELQGRDAHDLRRIPDSSAPTELKPLLGAMNGLFQRIEDTLERERRFTADAAHELRTPLAVLRAQWDVVRRSGGEVERARAEAKFSVGLDRLDRLVTQMLALSRLESPLAAASHLSMAKAVQWPGIVEQAISDCLALAERRRIEIACDWPPQGEMAMSMQGDDQLLTVLLRNLIDNAVRYAPEGTAVTLRFSADCLVIENDGESLSTDEFARMGERFHRAAGQQEIGSGLGVSIVKRIAALHGLELTFGPRADGRGMKVVLVRTSPVSAT